MQRQQGSHEEQARELRLSSSDPISSAVEANQAYVSAHGRRALATEPAKHLAIVTCMDSRLDIFGALGLDLGEAHILRNAGRRRSRAACCLPHR